MTFKHLLASTLCLLPASTALAQDTHTSGVAISDFNSVTADLFVTDVSVLDGQVCIGNNCTNSETFTSDTLVKLKGASLSMLFDDASATNFPDRDWRLLVNDSNSIASGGIERFSIEDVTAGTIPFTILGNAPENSLWIDDLGLVGLGTNTPAASLHVTGAAIIEGAVSMSSSRDLKHEILSTDRKRCSTPFSTCRSTAGSTATIPRSRPTSARWRRTGMRALASAGTTSISPPVTAQASPWQPFKALSRE